MQTICFAERANWLDMGVKALNLHNGTIETATEVPEGKYLKVQLAEAFDTEFLNSEEVSEATSRYAVHKGKKRDFILINGNKVVGYAAFHREEREYVVAVEQRLYTIVSASSREEALHKAEQGIAENGEQEMRVVGATEAVDWVEEQLRELLRE